MNEWNGHSTGSGMWGEEFNKDIEDALEEADSIGLIKGSKYYEYEKHILTLAKAFNKMRLEYETICTVCGKWGDNEFGEWVYGDFYCSWDCSTGVNKKILTGENK